MNVIRWCKVNWWLTILILICLVTTVAIFTPYCDYLNQWSDTLTKLLTPISIMLGIILGYPLIKKKLTEQYITKQFEIMDNANRDVRKKVIPLLDEYKVLYISNRLTLEYINNAFDKITKLKHAAIDASPDVYRYINLIYSMLACLQEKYSLYKDDSSLPHRNYQEQLSTWLHNQLNEVYEYSKTIGAIPSGEIINKKKLNRFLSKFVTRNDIIEIRDISPNIKYYHSEAMLVLYFGKTIASLSEDNYELYEAAYRAVPSPSPFARLLLNNSIYFPPVLQMREKIIFDNGTLNLIGYKRKKSISLESGVETIYYECCYSNTSDISFVKSVIKDVEDLEKFHDSYLNIPFSSNGIYGLKFNRETIHFRMNIDEAQRRFKQVQKNIKKTIKKEI